MFCSHLHLHQFDPAGRLQGALLYTTGRAVTSGTVNIVSWIDGSIWGLISRQDHLKSIIRASIFVDFSSKKLNYRAELQDQSRLRLVCPNRRAESLLPEECLKDVNFKIILRRT